jgi:hypothetical protein
MFVGTPLYRSVREFGRVNGEGEGGEILFNLAFQKVGPHLVQHVAEPVIVQLERVVENENQQGTEIGGRMAALSFLQLGYGQ